MLYSELGYPSLFSYCVQGLGYSDAAACRRIEAMRAIKDEPVIESKIASGRLSLSAVSLARTSMRTFERETGEKLSAETRKAVIESVEGLSKRAAEKAVVQTLMNETAHRANAAEPSIVAARLTRRPVTERSLTSGLIRVTMDLTPDESKVIEDLRTMNGEWKTTKDLLLALARRELCRRQLARRGIAQRELGRRQLARRRISRRGVARRPLTCKTSNHGKQSDEPAMRTMGLRTQDLEEQTFKKQSIEKQTLKKQTHGNQTHSQQVREEASQQQVKQVQSTSGELRQAELQKESRSQGLQSGELRQAKSPVDVHRTEHRQAKPPFSRSQPHLMPAPTQASRYIPSQLRREVWARAESRCEFVSKQTGQRCCARSGLEIDHVLPFAQGGSNTADNLRLYCRGHNVHAAVESFGRPKMKAHIPSLW